MTQVGTSSDGSGAIPSLDVRFVSQLTRNTYAIILAGGRGSRLMQLSVERQLGGRIVREWLPEGLRLSLWIPAASMSRVPAGRA